MRHRAPVNGAEHFGSQSESRNGQNHYGGEGQERTIVQLIDPAIIA
jgi:hypothetical protein